MTLDLTRDELTQIELALVARHTKGVDKLWELRDQSPSASTGIRAAQEIVKQALFKVQDAKRQARKVRQG